MPYSNSPGLINQLYRQRENIENMINQYTQNTMQPPVQNIINTSSDIDVKYLKANEDVTNVLISKKTLFIDENKCKIFIKELDGTISKTYDIVVPKDEKDLKIEELENKLKELEERVNVQSTKSNITNDDVKTATASTARATKSATVTGF